MMSESVIVQGLFGAHSEPLIKELELLNVASMFSLVV